MKSIIILLSLITLLVSCGRKAKKAKVTLRLSSGALVNGVAQEGGLIVMGKHRLIDQSFTLDGNISDDMVIELEKGHWDFYAIGWQGNNTNLQSIGRPEFGGDVRCNYQTKILETEEEQISFNMNLANCFQKLPLPHDFYPNDPTLSVSNNIPLITLTTCQDLGSLADPATTGTECASGANYGLGRSFLVKSYFHIGPEDGGGQHMGHMESHCFTPDANSELRLPLGDPNKNDGLPGFHILSFTDANCQGQVVEYKFNGLAAGPEHVDQDSRLQVIGGQAYLFLEHNSQTPSDSGGEQFFFFGSGKDGDGNAASFIGNNEERIIGIDATGTVLTVPGSTATYFSPGDEVMWYVNECNLNGCNSGFKPGRFNFAHVKSNDGNNKVTLHKSIHQETHYGPLALPDNVFLAESNAGSDYLSMQLVKVFNFDNLDVTGDIMAPIFSASLGKGGIRAFRVKNQLRANANAAQRTITASGKGRDDNKTIDTSGCGPGIPCMFMGGTTQNITNERGGGILFIAANELHYSAGVSTAMFIKAGATGTLSVGPPLNQAKGGTVIGQFGTIVYDYAGTGEPANIPSTQFHANGNVNAGAGTMGGYAKFEYCFTEDPNLSGGSVPTPVTASSSTGTVEVDSTPDYCDFL